MDQAEYNTEQRIYSSFERVKCSVLYFINTIKKVLNYIFYVDNINAVMTDDG